MGAKISCLCTVSTLDEVAVMKEDGELVGFKEGTTVKAVLAGNPSHKVVLCCQERTVLSDSFQLSCNQFYFLLPEGLELNSRNFGRLLRLVPANGNLGEKLEGGRQKVAISGKNLHSRGESKKWSNRWKPELETIPEVNSPPVALGCTAPLEVH